jgi:hypothetical protein
MFLLREVLCESTTISHPAKGGAALSLQYEFGAAMIFKIVKEDR